MRLNRSVQLRENLAVHPVHPHQVHLVLHRASSTLEECQSTSSAKSRCCRCSSKRHRSTQRTEDLVSVTVVLVLELHFKFISDDSDKNAYSFPGHWQREAGLMLYQSVQISKHFVKTALLTETSSGKELSSPVKCFPQTLIVF